VPSRFHRGSETFRFLLLVMVALIPIVLVAVLGPTWLALVVLGFGICALAARAVQLRMRRLRDPELSVKMAPPHLGEAAERRVLVVANDTLSETSLLGEVRRLASVPHTHVLLLVPALISPGERLTGAGEDALAQARVRLSRALGRLGADRDIKGEVSAAEGLVAVEDTFASFVPDEVLVSTRWERAAGGLDPRLAGLVRERFAVPVRHLVFEFGSVAQEPDQDAEARYQREFGDAAAWRFGLRALAGAGILAAVVLSAVALITVAERNQATAVSQRVAAQALPTPADATGPPAKVIDVSVIPEGKKGPEGAMHDDFTVSEFHVTVGRPLTLRIDNTDTQPHSISSPEAHVYIIAQPGTHGYTLLVDKPGKFEWHCEFLCDPWAMEHVGYMRGFITATPS